MEVAFQAKLKSNDKGEVVLDELERSDLPALQPVPLLLGAEVMEFEHGTTLFRRLGAAL